VKALGGEVVVKPLFGGEGRGLTRVNDEAVARRVFMALEQIGSVLYVQQFIPHDGVDWRLLVVGDDENRDELLADVLSEEKARDWLGSGDEPPET